jgi:chromate transporter
MVTTGAADTGRSETASLAELARAFAKLGCLSFGGPIAHVGYLRAEFVERRQWLDEAHFADLVALCQFLPGPASSQLVFAIGMHRRGLAGALVASLCFTLPSALLMIAFAYGVAGMPALREQGWLHGLKLAAVAVVAQAVWGMAKKLVTDRARVTICVASAAALLVVSSASAQLAVITAGALAGVWLGRGAPVARSSSAPEGLRSSRFALAALALFFALLAALPALASATGLRALAVFDSFYRAGSLVFGGGHVLLPLLRAEVVARGWLSNDEFLAGYGAAQALPGPLFTFAAYVGAAMERGPRAALHGLWALFAVFLPAWLLVGGALPFWNRLRSTAWAQSALSGANASVVGVLLAALYSPVITEGVHGRLDVAAALVAFALLEHWRAPPWLVVLLMAAAGQWAAEARQRVSVPASSSSIARERASAS